MYSFLKRQLSAILPREFILRHEIIFRKPFALWYFGKKYRCNICNAPLRDWVIPENKEPLCPACGSMPRNRRLWQILNPYFKNKPRILDFSPSRALYYRLKKRTDIEYISTDYVGEFFADKRLDITNTQEPNHHYDLIICFHVLEHIEDDTKAMQELFRILKRGGTALIQTPFKAGDIYENPAIISPDDRLLHFGQADHVRIYSVNALSERLAAVGFQVKILHFQEEKNNIHGFNTEEWVLAAAKI
jgi:SAM-dependent methyltransferase